MSLFLAIYENQKVDYYGYFSLDTFQRPLAYPVVWFMLGTFMCISGFRYKLGGSDYEYYHYFYGLITAKHSFLTAISTSQYEVGYTVFVYFCSKILHVSYEGSLVIEAFIFYFLLYEGLKKYIPNWGLFFMFFLYKMFFYVTFVAMRQAFTVAGFFIIMRYLEERKWIKYYASFSSYFPLGSIDSICALSHLWIENKKKTSFIFWCYFCHINGLVEFDGKFA